MQVGKMHGIALTVLGVILLGIQGMLYMPTGKVPTGGTAFSAPVVEHKTNPVAGILGIAFLLAGAAIFSTRRQADEPEAKQVRTTLPLVKST
jgi:hypothetical protein